jgi:hypothetical protein
VRASLQGSILILSLSVTVACATEEECRDRSWAEDASWLADRTRKPWFEQPLAGIRDPSVSCRLAHVVARVLTKPSEAVRASGLVDLHEVSRFDLYVSFARLERVTGGDSRCYARVCAIAADEGVMTWIVARPGGLRLRESPPGGIHWESDLTPCHGSNSRSRDVSGWTPVPTGVLHELSIRASSRWSLNDLEFELDADDHAAIRWVVGD